MSDEERRVAEALDPTTFMVHVTKTAMLLEQLAKDVSHIREKQDENMRDVASLRALNTNLERDAAVFRSDCIARVASLEKDFIALTGRLTWLNRTVIGGLIGGAIALAFKFLEK